MRRPVDQYFKNIMFFLLVVISFTAYTTVAKDIYKLCDWKNTGTSCKALKSQDSEVECIIVLDSAQCAILMSENKADFGVFNAEELLLTHQFYPDNFTVISEFRHKEILDEEFEFQAVAVASSKYDPMNNPIKGNGFCHPGFNDTNIWNDYILKYFEKQMYDHGKCRNDLTVAENEATNLKEYFGKACRPGQWVPDESIDKELKKKYPELCSLCDRSNCAYSNTNNYGHYGALDCLTSGQGVIAYVALKFVREYFKQENMKSRMNEFKFVCPDGNAQPLNLTKQPCAWIKQPWDAIVARKPISEQLFEKLQVWLKPITERRHGWTDELLKLLARDNHAITYCNETTSTEKYLSRGRNIEVPKSSCGKTIRWCTINNTETEKCNWVAASAAFLGIEPKITCNQTTELNGSKLSVTKESNLFQCFSKISHNKADVMSVDSNYGYIIRHIYNLSTVLYCETGKEQSSVVLAIVKNNAKSSITNFEKLKNLKACFPEYGGIAWMSFLNIARTKGLIGKSCDYPTSVANFFSAACAPGVKEMNRWKLGPSSSVSQSLCSICPPAESEQDYCTANFKNAYYGDKGAFDCLAKGSGDIAFIEVQNLAAEIEVEADLQYRVLCKNGSLAMYPGFKVDDQCALSVTIDSELVSRKSNSIIEIANIKHAFLKIEDWMGYRGGEYRPIHIYDPFNEVQDLLFKDSIYGLVDYSTNKPVIETYKELFDHVEACSGVSITLSSFSVLSIVVLIIKML